MYIYIQIYMCAHIIVNIFYICMYTYTHIHMRFRTVMKLNSVTQLNNISCNKNIGIKYGPAS